MSSEDTTASDKPARKKIGVLIPIAVTGLVVLLLVIALFAAWQRRNAARIDDQIKQMRAAGEPFTPADMESFYRLPAGREDCTQLYLAACLPLDGQDFSTAAANLPIVGANNHSVPPLPGQPWSDLEAVEAFLQEYQRSLDLLHEAARRGGGARYPTDFSQGINMLLPHAQNLRSAARMLQLQALARAHRGDAHGAAESIRAMWRAGESLEYEPIIISQLVRVAIGGMAAAQLQDFLPVVDFSDNDLRMLQAEFRRYDGQAAIGRSLRGERAIGLIAFDDLGNTNPQLASLPGMRLMLVADKAYYLEQMSRLIEAGDAELPASRTQLQKIDSEIAQAISGSKVQKLGKIMTAMLIPALSAATDANYRAVARCRVIDAALAAELYRRQQGTFPAKLDDLVPEFMPAVPLDPFTGTPLKMAVRGSNLVIYSVGADNLDDGGKEDQRGGKPDVVFTLSLPDGS
ncbi:MAG: hypothetical protein AB7O62_19850 [Pirellulales bacterium]